ncbi:hypothetical protein [Paenibacillus sp. AN1007]|uniref:Uncharacterized protein n=1 Tax=Paenibacillus sp. AN1007 TaxID=3151385 RepID=A0AAU8NG15_9BACL
MIGHSNLPFFTSRPAGNLDDLGIRNLTAAQDPAFIAGEEGELLRASFLIATHKGCFTDLNRCHGNKLAKKVAGFPIDIVMQYSNRAIIRLRIQTFRRNENAVMHCSRCTPRSEIKNADAISSFDYTQIYHSLTFDPVFYEFDQEKSCAIASEMG